MIKEKLFGVLLTSLYIVVFFLGYLLYMNALFEYSGFLFNDKSIGWYIYAYLMCIVPYLFYHKGKISSFLSTLLYLLLYIPIIVFYTFFPEEIVLHHILVQFFCFAGMILFFSIGRIKFRKIYRLNTTLLNPKLVLGLIVVLLLYVLFHFRSNLKLPSLADVYDLRAENKELASSGGMAYIILWLTYFFMPFSIAYGLIVKNRYMIFFGCLPGLIIYMATGAKLALFMPLFSYAFFVLFRGDRLRYLYFYLCGGLVILFGIPLLLGGLLPDNDSLQIVNSILLVRTVGNGGLLTYWYDVFFQTHPNTYFSHVNIINLFTKMYPYKEDIGELVGREFWTIQMNANANFWATDGIGGFGIYGILLLNILFGLVLLLLDYLATGIKPLFVILLFLPFATVFLNVSIFTSLLSGGVFFTILFLFGHQSSFLLTDQNK